MVLLPFIIPSFCVFHCFDWQIRDVHFYVQGGDTNTHLALRLARKEMFTRYNGARPGVPKVSFIALFTISSFAFVDKWISTFLCECLKAASFSVTHQQMWTSIFRLRFC